MNYGDIGGVTAMIGAAIAAFSYLAGGDQPPAIYAMWARGFRFGAGLFTIGMLSLLIFG